MSGSGHATWLKKSAGEEINGCCGLRAMANLQRVRCRVDDVAPGCRLRTQESKRRLSPLTVGLCAVRLGRWRIRSGRYCCCSRCPTYIGGDSRYRATPDGQESEGRGRRKGMRLMAMTTQGGQRRSGGFQGRGSTKGNRHDEIHTDCAKRRGLRLG